ncbi:hypothetical protein BH10ACI1_BH10ACI1_03110 [soil metagenome]
MERGEFAKALGKSVVGIGRAKVRSLMKEKNLKAIQAKAFKPKTTDSKGTTAAPNLLAVYLKTWNKPARKFSLSLKVITI